MGQKFLYTFFISQLIPWNKITVLNIVIIFKIFLYTSSDDFPNNLNFSVSYLTFIIFFVLKYLLILDCVVSFDVDFVCSSFLLVILILTGRTRGMRVEDRYGFCFLPLL